MKIRSHRDLEVYQMAFECAMEIFEISKSFPKEETYSLTVQIRRASRSVCTNISEGFRKRRYPKSFIAKPVDAEGETAESQVWLEFAERCRYISKEDAQRISAKYDIIIGKLVTMENQPESGQSENLIVAQSQSYIVSTSLVL